jgi:hypothetical protein
VPPGDTVLFTLPPAVYDLTLTGMPPACSQRPVLEHTATVFEPGRTTVVRFNFECVPQLTILTRTFGYERDDAYTVRLADADGRELLFRAVGAQDSILVDGLAPGAYVAEIGHVSSSCVAVNDGGKVLPIDIVNRRSAEAEFIVTCSQAAYRPELLRYGMGYQEGAAIVYFQAADAGSDQSAFSDLFEFRLDYTDCEGASLQRGPRRLIGLNQQSSRLFGQDTASVVFVLPGAIPQPATPGGRRCQSLLVMDRAGNTSRLVEDEIGNEYGSAPLASGLDVSLVGAGSSPRLRFDFDVHDPDDDLAGVFVTYDLEDGTLGPKEGIDETWLPNVIGWDGPYLPDQPMIAMPFSLERLVKVNVYFIDRAGNATLLSDSEIQTSS